MAEVDDLLAGAKVGDATSADIKTFDETPTPRKRATSGKFCVLKQVGEGDSASFIVVADSVDAQNRESAIKSVAITDGAVIEGNYVAVPLASWKVQRLEEKRRISLF